MHLDGKYNITDNITLISRAKVSGRPKKDQPVGFRAHKPDKDDSNSNSSKQAALRAYAASNYVGLRVAGKYNGQVYCGQIVGVYLKY